MDTDDHGSNNVTPPHAPPTGADESHGGEGGVFVCNRCGWHYANQNPSSRHRRAHRKICGTLPGYSSAVAAVPASPPQLQTFYSFVSADDHPSDDDGEFKTPSPSVLERSQMEMGSSGGTGGKSCRSEDEVFSDAVTDFVDAAGSSTLGLQQHKDIEGPVDGPSDETTQMQISEVEVHPGRVAPASEEYIAIAATELTGRSNPDVVTKEPADVSGDTGLVSMSDWNPMISKNQINDLGEVTLNSIDDLSDTYQENGETTPEVHVASGLDFSGDNDVKLSEGMPNIEKAVVVNPNTGGISKLDDENTAKPIIGGGDEKIGTNSSADDMQSPDNINTSYDKVDKEGTPVVAAFASSNESEGLKCMDDGNAHVLSVNHDITYVDNAEAVIKGFKGEGIKVLTSVKSGSETIDVKASDPSMEGFKSSNLSSSSLPDVQVVGDNLEVKGESSQFVAEVLDVTESEGTLLSSSDLLDNVEVKGESSKLVAKALDVTEGEGTLLSSSEVPVLGDNLEFKGESNKFVTNELVDGTEIDISCIANESLGEMEFSVDAGVLPVQSPEEQIGDHGDAILIGSNLDSTTEVSSADRQGDQLNRPDETVPDSYKIPNNEVSNVDDDSNIIFENERPNLLGGQHETDVTGTENSDPSSFVDQNVSTKMVETLEPEAEHRRSDIDVSGHRSQEAQNIESNFLGGVSTTDSEGKKIDRNVEPAAELGATASDAEVSQKSPQDLVANDLLISPPDTDSNKDECTRDLVGDVSDDKPELFSREGQVSGKHVDTSAADISVDSNSQTDRLEGQWGSVSVVSTQSDMPVSVDAEGGSSKSSRKMANAPPERQETDMFEAPSFMTLVEPIKGSASEIQNPQQSKAGASPAQAGWFPSITNVVNESEGRKKNEEIIVKATTHRSGGGTQLKSLLGEANQEMESRLPKKENTGIVKTIAAGGEVRRMKEEGDVGGKEWSSSPDREKRKVKGRPYWTHLVCCASVN